MVNKNSSSSRRQADSVKAMLSPSWRLFTGDYVRQCVTGVYQGC